MKRKNKEKKIWIEGQDWYLEDSSKVIGIITESKTKYSFIFKSNILQSNKQRREGGVSSRSTPIKKNKQKS
ncbi:hypothetical protein M0R19_02000 [Candidatus Pacearchaeota archaeon]|nr:hypothetical protein [Candidatus Pacearchaeota archaeon]